MNTLNTNQLELRTKKEKLTLVTTDMKLDGQLLCGIVDRTE
jgi:hypothetical protein